MITPQPAQYVQPYAGTVEATPFPPSSPLFERAAAHIGRQIVACLPGGATYSGTLDEVSDDGVLIVRDGDDVYEIDVEHVAVIESQRQR